MGSRLKVDFDQVTTKRPGGISRYAWALKRTKSELSNVDVWRAVGAEFLATFFFMFIVCLTLMIPQTVQGDSLIQEADAEAAVQSQSQLQTIVGISLAYATLIQCFEHMSGAYMNPAITVAMATARHLSVVKAIMYIVAQMTGSFCAVALCFGMIPEVSQQRKTISQLHRDLQPLQGFGIEVLQMVILTVTWLATYATSREHLGSSSLPVGVAYLAISLWATRLTGSAMNPARSLPPAVLLGQWNNLWVYVVAPFVGSVAGALLYIYVLIATPKRRGHNLASSGRSGEGESVQSDPDNDELVPLRRTESRLLDASVRHHDVRSAVTSNVQHQAIQGAASQEPRPSTRQHPHQKLNEFVRDDPSSPTRLLHRRQTLPPTTRASSPALQNLTPATFSGALQTCIALSKLSSRPATRPSTACGIPMTPRGRVEAQAGSRSHTPSNVFRTLSVTEPFTHTANHLIDDSTL